MQDVWPAVAGTPAKNVLDVRLNLAYTEFQAWAKQMKIESAAAVYPAFAVVRCACIFRTSR